MELLDVRSENAEQKKLCWTGCQELERCNKFIRLFYLSVQFFIWTSKLTNKLPNIEKILGETLILLDAAIELSFELFLDKTNFDCTLSRIWDQLALRARSLDGVLVHAIRGPPGTEAAGGGAP